MAFKRKEATIEATDLNTITPEEAEKRIIAGVKKYATNEGNWSKADANTPFLGHITGMGIESSNLADITMSIERQFLTKKTKRVPVSEGSAEFRLEDGELGKLRILDGQDATAATPGLSIKMLMDLGHMPKNDAYLSKVVSFAYVTSVGEGWRTNDALKKLVGRVEKLSGTEKDEAKANLKALCDQARAYEALIADSAAFAASRQKIGQNDQAAYDSLRQELTVLEDKIKGVSATNDAERLAALRAEEAEVRTRLKMSAQKLMVSSAVAREASQRTPVIQAKIEEIRAVLRQSLQEAERILA
ncbi:MAG: hypothetical protein KGL04_10645 [Elusimicrobia bacterium]|nr:hypothetical protein [Elusimicrobiota bacterium]MDE2314616.1 hypothetical protein [Elusimicrobiota bacterium]